jgi:hypothetical protein
MPHEIRSLRSTKGMDAVPLRHPRSPILLDWVSERGWLREWLHLTFHDYANLKGSNIDRFNSFPTEVCEME